jgi:hypothetical protein
MSALFVTILVPFSIFLDRYRRSVRVSLNLNSTAQTVTEVLSQAFSDLVSCNALWSVRLEVHTSDWKRNAGANTLNKRRLIRPRRARPSCIRGNVAFPAIDLGTAEIFFLPDAVLVISKNSVAALHYRDLIFSSAPTRFIEADRVPPDTTVVGHTWRFVNKKGGPDRRFNANRQLPVCQYGEMDFGSSGGLNGKIQFSNAAAGEKFSKAVKILIAHAASSAELNPIASYSEAKKWPSIVFLFFAVTIGLGLMARGLQNIPTIFSTASNLSIRSDDENSNSVTTKKSPVSRRLPPEQSFENGNSGQKIVPPFYNSTATVMPPQAHTAISPSRSRQPLAGPR